jgi:hypothetical protein
MARGLTTREARPVMSTNQIICPKCRQVLHKSVELEMRGEIKKAGGYTIRIGDPDETLSCPSCRFPMQVEDIIDGKHDVAQGGCVETIIVVVIMIVLFGIIVKLSS